MYSSLITLDGSDYKYTIIIIIIYESTGRETARCAQCVVSLNIYTNPISFENNHFHSILIDGAQ